ncbi:MAG: UDP-N-acetylglucosamine 2-epimerase, partial [bacterium]
GYIEFMSLIEKCKFVITDSGGVQEETTYLGKPCLTFRPNTERPITVKQGTNRLVTSQTIAMYISEIFESRFPKGTNPALWDGRTAGRVVLVLQNFLKAKYDNVPL